MLNITDKKIEDKQWVLLRLAFRPFFLLTAAFGVVAIIVWMLSLFTNANLLSGTIGVFWHGHEMVFGFAGAAIIGFLLTAVQTWTGIRAANGMSLAVLLGFWLIARFANVALLHLGFFSAFASAAVWFVAAGLLAAPVMRRRQFKNLIFIPVLIALGTVDFFTHVAFWQQDLQLSLRLVNAAIGLVIIMMTIVGGRVIPFFTANATGKTKRNPIKWLEWSVAVFTIAFVATYALIAPEKGYYREWMAFVCSGAAALHSIRACRWYFMAALKVPLLWSLHFSYWCIPAGFLLWSGYLLGLGIDKAVAIHVITIGAMATMILAMMSRVSLGHTGRQLQIAGFMKYAFAALLVAAITRAMTALGYSTFMLITSALWVIGFGGFLFYYWRVLTKPRVDGRPG